SSSSYRRRKASPAPLGSRLRGWFRRCPPQASGRALPAGHQTVSTSFRQGPFSHETRWFSLRPRRTRSRQLFASEHSGRAKWPARCRFCSVPIHATFPSKTGHALERLDNRFRGVSRNEEDKTTFETDPANADDKPPLCTDADNRPPVAQQQGR